MIYINFKKITKIILGITVILSGCFYHGAVLAYLPIVANAGPDQYLNYSQNNTNLTATLQGSGYDPNGVNSGFYWSCNGGSLSNSNIAQPVFTAPSNALQGDSYNCTLTVSDAYGLSAFDNAIVYVSANVANNSQVQTKQATNVNNNQATLNGDFLATDIFGNNYVVWFEWGTGTSYGAQTNHQSITYSGSFNQHIANLITNSSYHFRAVTQKNNGQIYYGQDMIFYNGANSQSNIGNANSNQLLNVSKTVRNLSSGNLKWSNYVNASPDDIVQFNIAMSSLNNQNVNNVTIKDVFPVSLLYNNSLTLDGLPYSGDIFSGLNIGGISAGQTRIVTYQAQVKNANNFSPGNTSLNNITTVTSSNAGYVPITVSASVIIAKGAGGATSVSTGLTNNFFIDSFFLPLMVALLGVWLYKRYGLFGAVEWFASKKLRYKDYLAEKQLKNKIENIKKSEIKW